MQVTESPAGTSPLPRLQCLRLVRTPSIVVPIVLFPVVYCTLVLFAALVSPALMVLGTVLGKVVLALAQWAGTLILAVMGGLREVR